MRNIKKMDYYYLDIRDINIICQEIYGKHFDVQMGEYANGTYMIKEPKPDIQGYWTRLGESTRSGSRYEGAEWVHISDEEAIEKWLDNVPTSNYSRPFEKIVDGEYDYWQPDFEVILKDLVDREEIPDGTYFISIDW